MLKLDSKKVFYTSTIFLIAMAGFGYGLAVASFHIWPFHAINNIYTASKSLLAYGEIVPKNLLQKAPPDAPRKEITIHQPNLITEGYYVFLGWDDQSGNYSARLYNHLGMQLHTWAVDYNSFDQDGPLNDSDAPHAFKVLPDASIIISFDNGDVMSRLDSCGDPVWSKQGVYHHSLEKAEDGSYWTWRGEGTGYGHYNYLENFDPENGNTIKELELVEDIIKKTVSSSAVFGIRPDYEFLRFKRNPVEREKVDIFHPNDIDILYSNLAHKFPAFNTGDLVLSFRNIHLIAVVDPGNGKIKWWSHGPWRFQHDPDFTEDGKISVYSNNTGLGNSEIIKIDPVTREVSNDLFNGNFRFYSATMGKHQYLPNGNVLIVIPGEGRIVEVSKQGNKVLEFNNLSALEGFNGHVANGVWLAKDFFDELPQCDSEKKKGRG